MRTFGSFLTICDACDALRHWRCDVVVRCACALEPHISSCDPLVLQTEVQADTEAVTSLLTDKRAELRARLANPSLTKEPPRISVAVRTTQARLSNLESVASERAMRGKKLLPGTLKAIQEGHEATGHMENLNAAATVTAGGEGGVAEAEEQLVADAFAEFGLETPIVGSAGQALSPTRAGRGGGRNSQASMRSKV